MHDHVKWNHTDKPCLEDALRTQWDRFLERWTDVGLIDPAAAERIRAFEADREKAGGLRWPMLLAVAFGGLL
ncbi:MAG: hypothetical protein ABFD98_06525, partial [Syntrophobacteraceae bacterium]